MRNDLFTLLYSQSDRHIQISSFESVKGKSTGWTAGSGTTTALD